MDYRLESYLNKINNNEETFNNDICIFTEKNIVNGIQKYKLCVNNSQNKNGFCEIHQPDNNYILIKNIRMNHSYVVNTFAEYFRHLADTSGRIQKSEIINKIFEFMIKYKYFLKIQTQVAEIIKEKLEQFQNDPVYNLIDVKKYKSILFSDIETETETETETDEFNISFLICI
jgi:hypothetical protein